MGCMEECLDNESICSHCGYDVNTKKKDKSVIPPNTFLADRYVIGKVLGHGGFGITYIAWDTRLEVKVAIKEYFPAGYCERSEDGIMVLPLIGEKGDIYKEGLNKVIEEARRLAKMNKYLGVVEVYDCIECNKTFYIVMEYLEGEELKKILSRVGKISAKESIGLIIPVMKSLQKIHENGMIHRDIAPDNIFITKEGRVVLLDLGSARYIARLKDNNNARSKLPVKDGFSALEQYIVGENQGSYTDVYALGATLYTMMTGRRLDTALVRKATEKNNVVEPIHKYCEDIDSACEKAIMKAIEIDIVNRTKDIKTFLNDLLKSNLVKENVFVEDYDRDAHVRELFARVGQNNSSIFDDEDDVETVYADEEDVENTLQDKIKEEDIREETIHENKMQTEFINYDNDMKNSDNMHISEDIGIDEDVEADEGTDNIGKNKDIEESDDIEKYEDVESDESTDDIEKNEDVEFDENTDDMAQNEDIEDDKCMNATDNKNTTSYIVPLSERVVQNDSNYTSIVNANRDADGVERWIPNWTDDTKKYVYFGTYPQRLLEDDEVNEEIISAYYGVNRTSIVRCERYKRISEADVAAVKPELWVNGDYKYFKYEPIKWRVLKNEEGMLTLLSDSILDCKKYHEQREEINYDSCSLKVWLNDNFLKFAFDRIEVCYIREVDGVKVDLLSSKDAKEYFANNDDRIASATEYALYEGVWQDPKNYTSWWWLKGNKKAISAKVNAPFEGYRNGEGVSLVCSPDGVRVLIHVNIV